MAEPEKRRGIFPGWWVLTACVIINCYSGGITYAGFTAFINPIIGDFGWTYALVSLAMSLRGFENGIIAPIMGVLVDRIGSMKLLALGSIVAGAGMFLFGAINDLWNFYVIALVISTGSAFLSPVVTMTSIAHWFKGRKASLPLGILAAGFAAGGLLVPPIIWQIDLCGWRTAAMILGIGNIIVCLPLAFLVRPPPAAQAEIEIKPEIKPAPSAAVGYTGTQALKTRQFWLLSIAVLFGGLAANALTIHIVPYLSSMGITRQSAGLVATVYSIGNITGRVLFGWLGDICDKRKAFTIASSLNAVGAILFTLSTGMWAFIPTVLILSIGFGGLVPLRPGLQSEIFGFRAFGTIQGFLLVFATIAGMIAPPWAGWMFDLNGSYFIGFITLAAVSFISVPAIMLLRKKETTVKS
jgi:MFS family permease